MEQTNAISIKIEESDYVAGAQFRYKLQWQRNRRANWMASLFFASLGVLLIASDLSHGHVPIRGLLFLGTIGLAWGLIALQYKVLIPRQMKQVYRKRQYPVDTVKLEWDDATLVMEEPVTRTAAPWAEMTRWHEDAKLFVLDFRGRTLMYVPKRIFRQPAAEQDFRRLLQDKIGPQGVVRTQLK
jgi:hypothetical protein